MTTHPPAAIPSGPDLAADAAPPRLLLAQALLDAALQAQRNGTLPELVRERPGALRWLARRHERIIRGTAGDALPPGASAQVASLLLRWLVTQLRPDAEASFDAIVDEAWLQLAGWRPMLAMASHAGFLRVPDFPRQYRRRSGEAVLDNLCGLWGVGPSTVYRLLERARHAMAQVLVDAAPDALRRLSLRSLVTAQMHERLGLADGLACRAWHLRQASEAQDGRDAAAELWHRRQAGDLPGFVQALRRRAGELAAEPETDALVERVAAEARTPRLQVDLWLARAALARIRNAAERELRAYEHARQVAQAASDPLLLGMVHGALGKYYEARDADRAFACYQDSADFLRRLDTGEGDADAMESYVTTLARLAWLYVLRNDERSRAVLDRAEALRARTGMADEVLGLLEQAWGGYWQRAGDNARSMEHRYRALNIFERTGDQRSVLATLLNLGNLHAGAGDYARAKQCLQVILDAARRSPVEPALQVSAHLNLGGTLFLEQQLQPAIDAYQEALLHSQAAGLRLHAFRARYNLAEAHYTRYRQGHDPEDERLGDAYLQAALGAPDSDSNPAAIESARKLKATVLAASPPADPDRLLPGESAVHVAEMAEVSRQRRVLSLPGDGQAHARAHLAIARSHMAMAAKEREEALALIAKHGLQAVFVAELDALRQTFERELTREQQLAAAWKQAAADIVDDSRRPTLIAHLLRAGAINKSAYGELCAVSPATASKHLGLLAERGLLVQRGKGPATRYELPG